MAVRLKQLVGYLVIAGVWTLLLSLVAFFSAGYMIYADLKAPERSPHARRRGADFIVTTMYERVFSPMWPNPEGAKFDPELIYIPKPGRTSFHGPEFNTWINVNEEGARLQPTMSEAETEAGGLVVMAGDSYTFGWGVNDEQTFSAILQSRFHHRTVNTGVPSYGTARELLRLRRMGLLSKASVLVIQYCQNDEQENREFLKNSRAFTRDPQLTWSDICSRTQTELTYPHVLGGIIGYSLERIESDSLWNLLKDIVSNRYGRRQFFADNEQSAVEFLAVLDRFPELVGRRILVTEMNAPRVHTTFLAELKKKVADRPNIQVVDVAWSPEDFFRIDMHLGVSGNAKVAAELDKAIRGKGAAVRESLPSSAR